MKQIYFFIIFLAAFFTAPTIVFSQNPGYKLDEKIDKFYGKYSAILSDCMHREFPMLVFTPIDYEKNKKNYPVVYMLHGTNDSPLTEEGLRKMYNPSTRINEMAELYKVIIVTPLVGNSYYLDSPIKKEHLFATFISQELTKFIDENYRTIASREGRILCGFSMGGYGSVSLLCRYPDIFSVALERAGVLDLATAITDLYWDEVGDNVQDLLGDYWTNEANYHLNGCFNLVNHIRHRKDVAFVIEVGKDDFLYKTNVAFHQWLTELNIPHIYNETPGWHEWNDNSLRSLLSNLQYFYPTQFK